MADTRQRGAPSSFSQNEAADIIREATARALAGKDVERALTREDLLAMAREMGVSEAAVESVISARAGRDKAQRRMRRAYMGLASHATSYTIVIGGLTLIDLFSGPSWWVQYPAIGWGMGLAFHAMGTLMAAFNHADRPR
ncbi:2TM domain-containing protein [Myxococcus sp. AM009]|uniref:2TM domain-containing protein n=1 Tax=unclassified Myxococcus TaxID=2648731 RepID=UPI0015952919|nr:MULTISPECIES: 2TM domain-containing protein [unclassified Myxococcus]NVI97385.1 2TM domain-containing protein [Myxococcus sp. AM009]NVJ16906.1 2TM domain-containing protein [Myxococcus sp. AM010]